MSLSYVEIYQNKIKKRNKMYNEEEKSPTSKKIISLIKKFPAKQRKTFKNDKTFKPRRIQNKSVEIIQRYRKTSKKKKTISKQKLENKNNNKNLNNSGRNIEKNKRKQINKNDIHDSNNKCYKTDIINENLNDKKDDLRNKYNNQLSKTYDINVNKQKKMYQEEFDNFNKINQKIVIQLIHILIYLD